MTIQSPDQQQALSDGAVLCDICTADTKREAVKTCLECVASYCEIHLEPHQKAAGLKRHTLLEPLSNLEARICEEHNQLRNFCKNDSVLICDVCAGSQHENHDVVSVQQAYEEMKAQLEDTEDRAQLVIQEKLHEVKVIKESARKSKRDMTAKTLHDLTTIVCRIQEKQKAAEKQAGVHIRIKQQKITELMKLKQNEDQLSFLQSFPNSPSLPLTKALPKISFASPAQSCRIQMELSLSVLKTLSSQVNRMEAIVSTRNKELQRSYEATGVSSDDTP